MRRTTLRLYVTCAALATFVSGCTGTDATPTSPEATVDVAAPLTATASRADKVWWAGLTQAQRGQLIVNKAKSYVGNKTFAQQCNCKEAVRRWVLEASRNVVTIPSTRKNNYEWENSALIATVTNGATARGKNGAAALSRIMPGDMIQMSLPKSPWLHTLIVESVSSSGIVAVEANYTRCTVTSGRSIPFADLLSTKKVANFTVYRALGG